MCDGFQQGALPPSVLRPTVKPDRSKALPARGCRLPDGELHGDSQALAHAGATSFPLVSGIAASMTTNAVRATAASVRKAAP
jgi:hypothetical protein